MLLFDFVTVMVSMILALCLSHVLDGLSYLYKSRAHVSWHAPHTLWLCCLVLSIVHHWWSIWDFQDLDWDYPAFLYILVAPILLNFAAGLIAPERRDTGTLDMPTQFAAVRRAFAAVFFAYVLAMWLDGPLLEGQPLFGAIGLVHIPMLCGLAFTFASGGRRASLVAPCIIIAMLTGLIFLRLGVALR